MHTITFNLITPSDAPRIAEGTIMFLPPHDQIPAGTYTDPSMNIGAYNHPIVILSCPKSPLRLDSKVEIAIMTSFHGTSIRTHLASKGIVTATGAEAAAKAGYLRVVTASKPHALGTLKLRNGKGMKRDCSYVGLRNTYTIALGALARYGGVREEVDAYRLTAHALRVLVGGIEERRGREGKTVRRRSVGAEKEKVEKERKDRIVREIEREVLSSTTVGARDEDIVMTERRKSVGNIVKGRAQDLIKEIPKEFLSPTALRARAREEKKRAAMEPRRRSRRLSSIVLQGLENSYGIVEKENKGDPEEELKSKKDSLNRDVLMGQLKFKQQRKGIEQKKTSRREKPKTQKEVHKLLKAKSQKLQERQELHRSAEEKLKLSKQRKLAEQEKLAKHVKANKLKKEQEEKHILGQQKLQEQKKQQQKLKQEEKLKQQKKAEEKQRVVEQQRLKKQRKIHQKTRVIEKKKVKEQRILKKEKKLKQGKKKVQLNRKKAKKL